MFQFVSRAAGMIVLALAVVMAVLDTTRSIAASAFILTPLAESWASVSPQSLSAFQEALEKTPVPFLWDPIALFILRLPGWLVIWVVAMVLLWIGQRRPSRLGRFASR